MLDRLFPGGVVLLDLLIAVAILALAVVLGWSVSRILQRVARRIARRTTTSLDDLLVSALRRPVFVALTVAGAYYGLLYLPFSAAFEHVLTRGFTVALAAAGVFVALSVADALLRWYGQEVAEGTRTSLDDKLIPVLRVLVPVGGGLLGLLLLLRMVGVEHQGVNAWLAQHGAPIIAIILLSLVAFFAVSRGLPRVIKDTVRRGMVGQPEEEVAKRSDTLSQVLVTTSQVVIVGTALLMVLSEFVNIAPVLAGVGVVGIAVGFGAQSLVKDLISGLFVIMEGQYHVGDVVKIADVSGLVENINLRRTVLRDLDGTVHFVPNGEVRVASNMTKEFSRVNLAISVAYGTDLDHAVGVINQVGKRIAEDPAWGTAIIKAPQVLRIDNLGQSGIDIRVVGETKPIKQWDVAGELRKRVKQAFDAEGIEIPFSATTVYFGKTPLQVRAAGDEPSPPRQGLPGEPPP